MTSPFRDTILRHCRAADPIPTGQPARLDQLPGTRAVLFDIYGTMLISASGEVGTAADERKSAAFAEALAAAEVAPAEGHTGGAVPCGCLPNVLDASVGEAIVRNFVLSGVAAVIVLWDALARRRLSGRDAAEAPGPARS